MSGFDKEAVRGRLRFLDLMAHEGVEMKRSGPNWVGRCPFHEERSGSFTVHGPKFDHGHCYGCGWNGDIFKFWMERRGEPFFVRCEVCEGRGREGDGSECGVCRGAGGAGALVACASLAQVAPEVFERKRKQASHVTRVADAPRDNREKPTLPRLRALNEEEIEALARLRGLDAAGISVAARFKRVGWCQWPQFLDRDGAWRVAKDAGGCWVVTDGARWVAQYRKMDGGKFVRKDGKEIKAWTQGTPTWPLGAGEIGERNAVLLVEGGADMLAAYHFLAMFGRVEAVAVCAMLGASCAMMEEALPHFARKRVRIVMDVDEANKKTGLVPSFEAAARWTRQLTAVGAAVESFSLAGLTMRDGKPVKDLNDLAMVEEGAWTDGELRSAFFDFDF